MLQGDSWIGGKLKDGKWIWSNKNTATQISVFDWAKGQPDNFGGNQKCLRLWGASQIQWHDDPKTQRYRFDDNHCDDKSIFICEMFTK